MPTRKNGKAILSKRMWVGMVIRMLGRHRTSQPFRRSILAERNPLLFRRGREVDPTFLGDGCKRIGARLLGAHGGRYSAECSSRIDHSLCGIDSERLFQLVGTMFHIRLPSRSPSQVSLREDPTAARTAPAGVIMGCLSNTGRYT